MVIFYWQYVRRILGGIGGVTNLDTAVGFFSKLRFHTLELWGLKSHTLRLYLHL